MFPYTKDEMLNVFAYFFDSYSCRFGQEHPPLRREQIRRIIQRMPFFDDHRGRDVDLDAEYYPALIDSYFATPFRNCDYRINHFFSGRVREVRFYDAIY